MVLVIIGIVLLIFILFIIFIFTDTKYRNFVNNNSVVVRKIKKINSKYEFNTFSDLEIEKKYLDKANYEAIECYDYLIYKLSEVHKHIAKLIRMADDNLMLYQSYLEEIENLDGYGEYLVDSSKYSPKKLKLVEKLIINKLIITPKTSFKIKVKLTLMNSNGSYVKSKEDIYDRNSILLLLHKLNEKKGYTFSNQEIEKAIIMIENANIDSRLRKKIYKRDNYTCRSCGEKLEYDNINIDYIIPITKGGKSTFNNLVTCCNKCKKDVDSIYLK